MASTNAISSAICGSVIHTHEDTMTVRSFPFHDETTALAHAPANRVFACLNDPKALVAHMSETTKMMMGSRLSIDGDADGGRMIRSKICMKGGMIGIPLSLKEVINARQVPDKKVWKTIDTAKRLEMAHSRMGFWVTTKGDSSQVRVFIDSSLPATAPGSWLDWLRVVPIRAGAQNGCLTMQPSSSPWPEQA